jgi:HD-like signal output (HDOD) protein
MAEARTRAEAVAHCVEEILKDAEFPALSRQIRDTMAVLDDEDASMQRLANIVLQDYSLTLKVILAANGFHYNRSGRPLLSATHAMVLLGFKTIRDLASSLLLFEHYHRKSPGLKELMLLSMLTANQAREAAERVSLAAPEQAHLCGMFRGLGEVLIGCHRPAEYAAILKAVTDEKRTPADACLAVLKFTYEDLGEAIAQHWGMPAVVAQTMRSSGSADRDDLGAIVSFSHELTTAVYRHDSEQSPSGVGRVFEKYKIRLGLDRDDVTSILEGAVQVTRETFAQARISVNDLRLRRQTRLALQAISAVPDETAVEPAGGAADATGAEAEAGADPVAPSIEELRERFAQEIDAALGGQDGMDLNRMLLMVLEGIYRGGPFDRVMFCLVNADRSEVRGRFGLGADVDPLVAQFQFPLALSSAGGPVARALVTVLDLWCGKAAGMAPDEAALAARFGSDAFAVFPVMVQGRIVGCLYFDRCTDRPAPDAATLTFLRRLRDAAARAVEITRTTMAPPRKAAPASKHLSPGARSQAILRVLRGEAVETVSRDVGVAVAEVELWRRDFLAGALAALGEKEKNGGE